MKAKLIIVVNVIGLAILPAQPAPPASRDSGAALQPPVAATEQLTGTVSQYLMNSSGRVDGCPVAGLPVMTLQPMTATGEIKALLHARRGEVDGAVLDDGTILHIRPDASAQFSSLLAVEQSVSANGVRNSQFVWQEH